MVPKELTETLNPFRSCMLGTNTRQPHCLALQGVVGDHPRCIIYAQRPSACRAFGVEWKHGQLVAMPQNLERCNQARQAYHLPPLSLPIPDLLPVAPSAA